MTHVTCRLTAKNWNQLGNPTLGNQVWATFTFQTAAVRDILTTLSIHVQDRVVFMQVESAAVHLDVYAHLHACVCVCVVWSVCSMLTYMRVCVCVYVWSGQFAGLGMLTYIRARVCVCGLVSLQYAHLHVRVCVWSGQFAGCCESILFAGFC